MNNRLEETPQIDDTDIILEVHKISKRFGGIKALNNIDFSVRRGEVHALVGENGAGKSTFIKILTGAHAPSEGKIMFDGKEYSGLTPALALDAGITAIYQSPPATRGTGRKAAGKPASRSNRWYPPA